MANAKKNEESVTIDMNPTADEPPDENWLPYIELTCLQEACKNSNLNAIKTLLDVGVDPNLPTEKYKSPLEIAGRKTQDKYLQALLNHRSTAISEQQFRNFVEMRGTIMKKTSHFEMLLLSEKLNVDYKTVKKRNSPLHYAIFFDHKHVIQKLLERGSSLFEANEKGKCAFDLIEEEDLQKYFDRCTKKDGTNSRNDPNYQLYMNFACLINEKESKELQGVAHIAASSNLRRLLLHPLVRVLISLKWFRCRWYFYLMIFSQFLLFTIMSLYFYFFDDCNQSFYILGMIPVFINVATKSLILLNFVKRDSSAYKITTWQRFFCPSLHSAVELSVIFTTFATLLFSSNPFYNKQIRSVIFIEMAICFLLTCGYHLKLSKWSVMLQRVFKTFTVLSLFFSLFVIAFAMGFHILFKKNDQQKLFSSYFTSIFKSYIMMTGEFDVNDVTFDSGFAGFLIFLLFAMCISLVIVNFWTGVAVTDIEKIERDSELNAFQNVLVFFNFVDILYSKSNLISQILFSFCGKPYLFVSNDESLPSNESDQICEKKKSPRKFGVRLFINKKQQVDRENHPNLPKCIDSFCLESIKRYCRKSSIEAFDPKTLTNIQNHLKGLEKRINQLNLKIGAITQTNPTSRSSNFEYYS